MVLIYVVLSRTAYNQSMSNFKMLMDHRRIGTSFPSNHLDVKVPHLSVSCRLAHTTYVFI